MRIRPGVRELMHHDPVLRELVTAQALNERVHILRKALQKKHAWAESEVSEENLKKRKTDR